MGGPKTTSLQSLTWAWCGRKSKGPCSCRKCCPRPSPCRSGRPGGLGAAPPHIWPCLPQRGCTSEPASLAKTLCASSCACPC
eukprot:5294460-Lingulodinium_polyedra.AAC.1